MKILPPARPKRSQPEIGKVLNHYGIDRTKAALVFVRGYYLDSMGQRGRNDLNVYDDAAFILSPSLFESFNANTDPSFGGRRLAMLNLGKYKFQTGKHRGQYRALRAFPEGVELPCSRDGRASTCRYINIHKGGSVNGRAGVTWSEGCLTIPWLQYSDWVERVYDQIRRYSQQTIDVVLVENRQTESGQHLYDHTGRII